MIKAYIFIVLFFCVNKVLFAQSGFVRVAETHFSINKKPYYFIGANYWYGGLLALNSNTQSGKKRLLAELNFLKSKGVNNLRVLVGAEGEGEINGVKRVKPALQPNKGVFDARILEGLDFLLKEMATRKMYAVLYLSNNWEWSGGFMQYLNWNGQLNTPTLMRKLSWDEQRDYTSKFYTCSNCISDYKRQLDFIFNHVNIYTRKKYSQETAIMAWELANEPRPMQLQAVDAYKKWIIETAAYIKKSAPNQLVTIGSEGLMGSEENISLFEEIHQNKNIDYLTIHIWPKNWSWFKNIPSKENLDTIIRKTEAYINVHQQVAKKLNKPLVIEEFGLPRDGHDFSPTAATSFRDEYYNAIFSICNQSKVQNGAIAGCNFWAYGGMAKPVKGQLFWQDGNDFSGDPPQEEQGLNSVFNTDLSTWTIIQKYNNL